MNSFIGVMFGVSLTLVMQWYSFRIWGDSNHLGILLVYCRKSKWTRWLCWNIWGNDDWYLNELEKRINLYRAGFSA